MTHILAIDQGTTSTRSVIFDAEMKPIASAQQEFQQYYPNSGWVEHDPEEILRTVTTTMRDVLAQAEVQIAAIGITNQRETVLVWDKDTGKAVYPAIVWQDRRTAKHCAGLQKAGAEDQIAKTTGLLLDPYFSASKVAWILDHVEGARQKAEAGQLLFGTIDSFLIWSLSGGENHVTDATNAARTMLYDIHQHQWSSDMCALLNIPMQMLPEVKNCADHFADIAIEGVTVPILGVAGDQQAAAMGQGCFAAGMLKSTYGTGCFALLNTGATAVRSSNRLLTTIAYQLDGEVTYALEGSVYIAGAVVQWLRDGLGIIDDAPCTQALAEQADPHQEVILVPAFTGLGAPYWNSECRGAIYGLERSSGAKELARAALQSVGYQTRDLVEAMKADVPELDVRLRVDGGMAANDYAMQFIADITGARVEKPALLETTVLGAAWLAGMQAGIYPSRQDLMQTWQAEKSYRPNLDPMLREAQYAKWQKAVAATLSV